MKTLDKYISRHFLNILFFALVAFITIFVIVDLVDRLDVFIARQVPKIIILKFYIYYMPYIVVLTLPIAMLLASLFSIGTMARHNEIVAMKAAGMSLYRILLPVFIIGFIVSWGALWFGEYVVPVASVKRSYIVDEYLEKQRQAWRKRIKDIYITDSLGRKISMRYYDAARDIGHIVSIRTFVGDSLTKRIDARRMVWEDSAWVLYEGYERAFPENPENTSPFKRKTLSDENLMPEDFRKILKQPEEMSYKELAEFIKEVRKNRGNVERWMVDLHLKIAVPFASFIIVLFGAPLSSPKRRSGTAMGFGISLAVCFIYFGIVKTAQTMGHNGNLPPLISAWVANIIFGVAGFFVLIKAPK
ncbi:MAG: LPS export ABC transporter permease LptG [Calditrichaeota bacterium]|nr:LPS export ABC transporter permease LptG [Calditrichota bacterium]